MPLQSLEEQIDNWCKHYTGAYRGTCRMGINYRELGDDSRPGYLNRLPCLREHLKEDHIATCTLREWHTTEEIAARVKETENASVNYLTARAAITDHLKATGEPTRKVSGQIPCPICEGGTLRFSIASNGHCHGRCSNQDCVNWIE